MGDFIPTRAALKKKGAESVVEVVTFQSHKSKKKAKKQEDDNVEEMPTHKSKSDSGKTLNIKHAKFEVMKFGMSGFDAKKKQDAKIQLAIRLGAKPPKNKYRNYKELLQEKKEEKKKQQEDMSFQELGKNKIGKSNTKTNTFKRKKKQGGLLDVYGTVKTVKVKK